MKGDTKEYGHRGQDNRWSISAASIHLHNLFILVMDEGTQAGIHPGWDSSPLRIIYINSYLEARNIYLYSKEEKQRIQRRHTAIADKTRIEHRTLEL